MSPEEKIPERLDELDEESQKLLQSTLAAVRTGPSILQRRGSPKPKAWTPPAHVEFVHPKFGQIEVHVESGAVYAKDAAPEEKAALRATAEAEANPKSETKGK